MPSYASPELLYQRRREPTLAPPVVDRSIIIRIERLLASIVSPSRISCDDGQGAQLCFSELLRPGLVNLS
jgi:hypothetical protein